jgi:hypothetical protein
LPKRGTTTAEALMQERPPFSAIEAAMRSMKSGQRSISSSPMRILLKPGPWTENFGLSRYCATVPASPKDQRAPQIFITSPAPS